MSDLNVVRAKARIPAARLFAILFFILLLTSPPDGILSDNEENYFGLAAQSVAQLGRPVHSALFDGSHHRFLNEFLLGHLIAAVGFEWAQMVARTLTALFGAWALSLFVRGLKVRIVDVALAMMTFILLRQTLFGGEWQFRGYEAKVPAYILVVFGLHAVMTREKLVWGMAALIAATYFHFQVGGFWFLAVLLYLAVAGRFDRHAVRAAAVYVVGVSPLMFVVAQDRLLAVRPVDHTLPTADVIYSLIRAPHHVAPFMSWPEFMAGWLPGLLAAAPMLAGAIVLAVRTRAPTLRRYAIWVSLLLGYLLTATAISFVDRRTGVLGKFYLFRPASLILLLWLLLIAAEASHWTSRAGLKLRIVFGAVILPAFLVVSMGAFRARVETRNSEEREKRPLFAALTTLTQAQDVVLIDPTLESRYDDFERRTGRVTLMNWKFDNTNDRDVLEWYDRVLFREELFTHGCHVPLKWSVNFLLVSADREEALARSCGPVVYRDSKIALIRVRPVADEGT